MFPNDMYDPGVLWQIIRDRSPSLTIIVGLVNIHMKIAHAVAIECCKCSSLARTRSGHARDIGALRQARNISYDIRPGSAVLCDLQVAVICSDPENSLVHRRLRDGCDRRPVLDAV